MSLGELVVVSFAAGDYYRFANRMVDREGAVANYVRENVGDYRKKRPTAKVICVNDRMARLCNIGFIWFHFLIASKSYSVNEPMPTFMGGSLPRFL